MIAHHRNYFGVVGAGFGVVVIVAAAAVVVVVGCCLLLVAKGASTSSSCSRSHLIAAVRFSVLQRSRVKGLHDCTKQSRHLDHENHNTIGTNKQVTTNKQTSNNQQTNN